jgi:hypothetical protein
MRNRLFIQFFKLLVFGCRAVLLGVVEVELQFADGAGLEGQGAKDRALAGNRLLIPFLQLKRKAAAAGKMSADLPSRIDSIFPAARS